MYKFVLGGVALLAGAVAVAYGRAKEEMEKEETLSESEDTDLNTAESSIHGDGFSDSPYSKENLEEESDSSVDSLTTENDGKLEILLTTLDGISKSYTNALATKGIFTVKHFMNKSDEELMEIKGIGEKSVNLIRDKIEAL